MKISNILLEGLTLYLVDILIKTDKDINKVEVYNQIRAVENVVVVTVEQNDFLQSKSTDQFDYEMLHLKFLASKEPREAIDEIKKSAMVSGKIPGLRQFIIRYKTIQAKGKY
jgi:hypothetical protein